MLMFKAVRRGVSWGAKALKLKLSGVVAIVATGIALVHHYGIKECIIRRMVSQHAWTKWVWGPVDLCVWHAVCVGYAVALASSSKLAGKTTWLLGKRESGRMDPVRYCLGASYQLGIQTKLYLERTYGDEPVYNEIIPTVYLGGWPSGVESLPAILRSDSRRRTRATSRKKIAVIDVTCELPCKIRHVIDAYHLVPVWDSHAPQVDQITRAVEWAIPYAQDDEYILYIHCAHGHGRSATVLGAILIAMGVAQDVDGALECMKKHRPLVRLNSRQRDALVAWVQKQ